VDDDNWLVLPKKFKTDIDQKAIKNKYKKLKVEIEEAIKEAQEDNSTDSIDRMLEKVRKMRKAGLESAGELSDENLAYKVMRTEGLLQKMFNIKEDLIDKALSV
jgi:hypothetical protein